MGDRSGTVAGGRPSSMATPEGRAATWRRMSGRGDVHLLPDGRWMVTGAEAVQQVCRQPSIFSSAPMDGVHGELPVRTIPSAIDPPEHRVFRRHLDPMFAPRVVATIDDELRRQVRELVAGFAGEGRCDLMADLAAVYPTSVFMAMFGLPLSDRDLLRGWVATMVEQAHRSGEEALERSDRASWSIYDYMRRAIDEKRANPGDDVLSRILAAEAEEAWPLEDLVGICIALTMAGLDTVTAAIGWTFLHLAREPELRHRVTTDPHATTAFIEELLRFEPPAPFVVRLATEDAEVGGVAIPAGSIVVVNVATANRDPRRYPSPDVLDLEQAELGHLTFGGGIHRCLGSHLARRELRLVIEEFHRQIPDYELATSFEPRVEWPSGTLHLEELPLVFPSSADR